MQTRFAGRPTVPFVLSLIGLIVSAIAAVLVGLAELGMFGTYRSGSLMGGMMGSYYGGTGMMNNFRPWGMSGWAVSTWIWVPILVVSIALAALGVFMMSSSRMGEVRIGSVLALVAAVLAFPTAFGFIVGSVLMLTGGVLGLIWTPTRQAVN